MAISKKAHNWNTPIMWICALVYGSLLILFGWQTWQFVNWLFPDDQLLAKILTMLSFDLLAAVWGVVHTFYRFASRGAKQWVIVAWVVTFILSLTASVLYLVIQFFFRFQITVNPTMVYAGYGVSIVALVFNILALMSFLILEWQKRHPRQDEFEAYESLDDGDDTMQQFTPPQPTRKTAALAQTASTPVLTDEEVEQTLQRFHAYRDAREAARKSPLAPAPQSNQNGANGASNNGRQ